MLFFKLNLLSTVTDNNYRTLNNSNKFYYAQRFLTRKFVCNTCIKEQQKPSPAFLFSIYNKQTRNLKPNKRRDKIKTNTCLTMSVSQ